MLLAGLRMAAHQYIARKESTSTPKGVFSSHHPRLSPSSPSKSFPHNQAHLGRLTILRPSLRETPSFRKGIAIATITRPEMIPSKRKNKRNNHCLTAFKISLSMYLYPHLFSKPLYPTSFHEFPLFYEVISSPPNSFHLLTSSCILTSRRPYPAPGRKAQILLTLVI